MTPFSKFLAGLHSVRNDLNDEMEELIAYAEVLDRKTNSLELDEDGFFFTTAAGPLESVLETLQGQVKKLERIKKQKDGG